MLYNVVFLSYDKSKIDGILTVADEFSCCDRSSSIEPVSYTHLDVYKRQRIYFTSSVNEIFNYFKVTEALVRKTMKFHVLSLK